MSVVRRTIKLRRPRIAADRHAFFRFGLVGGRILLSNDAGDWCTMDSSAFAGFLAGRVQGPPRFVRDGEPIEAVAARLARRKRFLAEPPRRHVIAVTRRAAPDSATRDGDMTPETAKKVADFAMKHPSGPMVFEILGGDPCLNPAVVRFLVEYLQEKNRYERRPIRFELRTGFAGMTRELSSWLASNGVFLRTGLDGPQVLHDGQRAWTGHGSFADTSGWIRDLGARYAEAGLDPQRWYVRADPVVTRRTFECFGDVAATYTSLGIRSLRLRPLERWQVPAAAWSDLGYSIRDWVGFHRAALRHLLALESAGTPLAEETAAAFAAKILDGADPAEVDHQSPSTAGTGQLAYDVDGAVYPDAESLRLAAAGDGFFRLGEVGSTTPEAVRGHPTVRTLATASLQDTLPACSDCWNAAFCFVSPVEAFRRSGDVFGQRPNSPECAEHMAVSGHIFDLLLGPGASAIESALRRWIERISAPTPAASVPGKE